MVLRTQAMKAFLKLARVRVKPAMTELIPRGKTRAFHALESTNIPSFPKLPTPHLERAGFPA